MASAARIPVVDLFRSCDLDLDPITFIYVFDPYSGCANMDFLCEVFQKLSSDRQTESAEIINHAALRVVKYRVTFCIVDVRTPQGRSVARLYFSRGTGLVSIDTARSRPNQRPPRVVHSNLAQSADRCHAAR